ncbi:uncharacterized protein N7483_008153 [Penicillium malachiteum]|uniref:uncharacterized protein n=1 Tax=Penicillium malachiteum TaxID=1324776 RepID=UPI002546E18C|nr:uncharacterized protein N7483_008153 [Penicillium malachiteum]KAJ5720219.1 hypothetical protein N7483_008153 [Penicillium malachiteum]
MDRLPWQDFWIEELPKDPKTLSPKLVDFLVQFNLHPAAPYVYSRPISWSKAFDKANWSNHLLEGDADGRDFFSNWSCSKKPEMACSIALFSMWTSSWVRDPDWDSKTWHV